jgi:hypothetical protein
MKADAVALVHSTMVSPIPSSARRASTPSPLICAELMLGYLVRLVPGMSRAQKRPCSPQH